MQLSILITTINEEANLRSLLPELRNSLDRVSSAYEILVVDGGSTDDTVASAKVLGCRVERQTGPGYAQAIRDGFAIARGEFVIVMDADGSHHPSDVVRLFEARRLADTVIASRYVKGGGSQTSPWRIWMSKLLNFAYRLVLWLPYREVSGGFRVYRRDLLQRIPLESEFYEIQEEILIKAHWMGQRITEIPYVYRDRRHGVSKARFFAYGFRLFAALIRFRLGKQAFLRKMAAREEMPRQIRGAK